MNDHDAPAPTPSAAAPSLPAAAPGTAAPAVAPSVPSLRRELRGPALLGAAILVGFFVVGGGWAAMAPIAGAAIAGGVVSPEGSRQVVQHLEGGIVHDIRVREGDRVQAGDVLVTLAGVGTQAEAAQLGGRLRSLAATEARLQAERVDARSISFSHPSLANTADPEVMKLIQQQNNQFTTRNANDESQRSILGQRIAQLQQQIVGAEKQLVSVRQQNELIRQEIIIVREMVEKGYERKSRLLALQRDEAELLGQEGELLSRVARAEEQIGETRLQITNIRVKRKEEVDQQLTETQAKRVEVEQQIMESLDKVARINIIAPVSGTVLDLKFKTTGGVIRPGEEVLSIVPDRDNLIIDARISPNDIDDVHAGQHAYVIFPSFPQRSLHRIDAKVRSVSADAFTDEKTGQSYFTAKIEIDRAQL
ncbi:MAG TPA: HlyD family type I secretion periplasmic adaptor subunit, partial [Rhodospirillales bacterium]|nr:HlyD family type I secretion periplasmic adaptor subunit [Rhodospirillales bacterium]